MKEVITWWLSMLVFGLAALPITAKMARWLPAQGYAFSKITGLLLVSYLLWMGAQTGLITNNTGGVIFALLLVMGIGLWIVFRDGPKQASDRLRGFWHKNRSEIFFVELLFLVSFCVWALVRAYAPDKILPAGGEKYMEIAFLNGILNSPRFPPLDPWLSGFSISYYYFGYVMMAVMTRITGSQPTVAFDLYDALLFALTCLGAYGVASSMCVAAGGKGLVSRLTGLLGALFVAFLGNLQGLFESLYSRQALPDSFWDWLSIPGLVGSAQNGSLYPGHGWWWWRASRVLNDLDLFGKPVVFQPIDEFPFFSFLLGDNHPHKLALPFVLLCIALAFNLLLRQAAMPLGENTGRESRFFGMTWPGREESILILFNSFALGSLGFLNTWDMPVYLLLFLLAYTAGELTRQRALTAALFLRVIRLAVLLGIGAIGFYILFYLSFSSQAGGVLPYIFQPTRLTQYLVMFGPFIFILAWFLVQISWKIHRSGPDEAAQFRRTAAMAWLWLVGIAYSLYLLALLTAIILQNLTGGQALAPVQSWLGNLTIQQAALRILLLRLLNPWLFLLASCMMALAVAAFLSLRSDPEEELGQPLNVDITPPPGTTVARTPVPRDGQNGATRIISPPVLFALILLFVGLGLTLSVEFFYLRDNFGMRMNTVFKFYYQGWVLMACASAYAAWWVVRQSRPSIFLTGAVLLVASALVYPILAVTSRTEGFTRKPDLDAAATIAGEYQGHWAAHPEDWAAIQWINTNIRPALEGDPPVLLEAPGGGYEHIGRFSAFTGLPTLLGWINHEGQWRGSQEEINRRLPVIEKIYTTPSKEQALDLLHEWNVRYLIVGGAERQFIEKTCANPQTTCSPARAIAKFDQALLLIYSQDGVTIYSVP